MIDVVRLLEALNIKVEFERGGELWARCPYPGHEERTASWSIRNDKGPKHGFNKCFGCKQSGGPVRLVVAQLGIGYSGARSWIEERGLDKKDPVSLKTFVEVVQPKYGFMTMPPTVKGIGQLATWPKPFRRFAKRRGLTAEQVNRWLIGYAAEGKLADRVVFPIRDDKDALKSYSARYIIDGAVDERGKPVAKYLTASIGQGADHGAVFGAFRWPPSLERRRVYVCEGVLNALAIERVITEPDEGIAALDGSEVLPGQTLAIGTFSEIVVVTDPDTSGDHAASMLGTISRWRDVRRVNMPKGEDPNSLPPDELRRSIVEQVDRDSVPREVPPRTSARSSRGGYS